ncbi:M56 family metallopeptidase [Aquimarina sp. W85]|uniref:M56 family metallopeptidase n=1 Tax=Aquimarina rhodophyticola TaxID=3342246 RepID=UPI00366B656E
MHTYKRFYLLISIAASFIIPLLTITYETEVITSITNTAEMSNQAELDTQYKDAFLHAANDIDYNSWLWGFYSIGFIMFSFRFIKNLFQIKQKIKRNPIQRENSHVRVLIKETIVPHSFLHYIFLPFHAFKAKAIPKEIIRHEEAHVREKHTWDILFLECIQILCWFNPLLYLFKVAIKLNHEFLADASVLKNKNAIQAYQNLLITFPNSLNQTELSSAFNYSLTKKRLQMMTTHFSSKNAILRLLGAVPVFGLCTLLFCNDIVAQTQQDAQETIAKETPVLTTAANIIRDQKKVIPVDSDQMNQYNRWVQKVNKGIQSEDFGVFKKAEVADMQTMYDNMTPEQRAKVPPFPSVPAPTLGTNEKLSSSMIAEYNAWAKDAAYQLKNKDQVTIFDYHKMSNIYNQMSQMQRENAERFPDLPSPPPVPKTSVPAAVASMSTPPMPPTPPTVAKVKNKRNIQNVSPVAIASPHIPTAEQIEETVELAMRNIHDTDYDAIAEAEVSREQARMAAEIARIHAEVAREQVQHMVEAAEFDQDKMRDISEKAQKQAMKDVKKAIKRAKKSRINSVKIRREALKAVKEARIQAQAMRVAAQEIRREALQTAQEVRREALREMQEQRIETLRNSKK